MTQQSHGSGTVSYDLGFQRFEYAEYVLDQLLESLVFRFSGHIVRFHIHIIHKTS